MSIDILKEDIKSNKIRKLYLFYGPEEYLKRYYSETIEKAVVSEDMKQLNKIVFDGKPDTKKIMENCDSMPVFADKKLVLVKNSGLFKGKKGSDESESKEKNKGKTDDFASYLANVPDFTCLIFLEEEVDKRMKAFDAVKKSGLIVEFPFQKPAELVKWAVKVFKSNKKDIDSMTASILVENSEQGMSELLNEINKVVLFVSDRTNITMDDIHKVCSRSVKSRIFDLTDAAAEKNPAKALELLNDMVVLKEPVPKIYFMIIRHLRQLLEVKALKEEGLGNDGIISALKISPYAATKLFKQVPSFSMSLLKDVLNESFELDLAVKTGKINDRIAAELLIIKFAGDRGQHVR